MTRLIRLIETREKGKVRVECHQVRRDPGKYRGRRKVWYLVRGYVDGHLAVCRSVRPQPTTSRRNNLSCRQRDTTRRVFHALYDLHGTPPDLAERIIQVAQNMERTLQNRGVSKMADSMNPAILTRALNRPQARGRSLFGERQIYRVARRGYTIVASVHHRSDTFSAVRATYIVVASRNGIEYSEKFFEKRKDALEHAHQCVVEALSPSRSTRPQSPREWEFYFDSLDMEDIWAKGQRMNLELEALRTRS